MAYLLRPRSKSSDFDIVNDRDQVRGHVITSPKGYTVYLIGDYEALTAPLKTIDEALQAFTDWTSNNTTSTIPIIRPRD